MEIVIADPDRESREHLTALLRKLCPGAHVSGFGDPMFLVQHCLTRRPDAVFTEIAMPPSPLDGLTLVAMLRKRYPQIRSFIVTGSGDYRGLAAPLVDGYLLKPAQEALLRETFDWEGGAQ